MLSLLIFLKYFGKAGLEKAFTSVVLLTLTFAVHILSYDLTVLLIPIFILLGLYLKGRNKLALFMAILLYSASFLALAKGNSFISIIFIFVGLYFLGRLKFFPKWYSSFS